jgi:hypothetical protein
MALATGIAAVAIPASGQPLPTQEFPYKSGPVTITSCTLNENKSNSTVSPNSLRINYFDNLDGSKITSITFRVRYGGTPVTLTDTGSFDYRQSITHQFNLLGGQPWSGSSPQVCRVLTATFADGRVVNPPYDGPDGQAENAPPPLPPAGAPPAALPPPAVVPPPAPAPAAT